MRPRFVQTVQVQGGMSLLDRRTRTVVGSYLLTAERAALADTCSAFKEAVLEASCLWTEISHHIKMPVALIFWFVGVVAECTHFTPNTEPLI